MIGFFRKIEWTPLNVPLERRRQVISVIVCLCIILYMDFIMVFVAYKMLYSEYRSIIILFSIWMLYDMDTNTNGGRVIKFVRDLPFWRYFRDYFPVKLVKTADLDPSRNYLFCCFPHGVTVCAHAVTFASNALNFEKVYPGMSTRVVTLPYRLKLPITREIALAHGLISSSEQSLLNALDNKKFKGRCVCLLPGGAAEAMESEPGITSLVLKKRKGFVRLAIVAGSPLVPVFYFGETDIYRTKRYPKGSFMRTYQETIKNLIGIAPVFPFGRGIFQYTFGMLPLRKPITVVVGAPVEVTKNADPTPQEVDAVHAKFVESLVNLFESNKAKYMENPENAQISI